MNTLAMTDKLQAAGVPEKQARAHIEVLQDATAGLATTADLLAMEARLRAEIKADIAEQTASLSKLQVTTLVAAVAIFAMIVKLL